MNDAHYHLVFNHLPIIIPFVGLVIMIVGLILRSEVIKRTSYAVFILGAISTIPAFLSGEGAEEIVEELEGIGHNIIHDHEEIAEKFAMLSYALGIVSVIGLWSNYKKKTFSNIVSYITIALCLVALFLAKQTGTSGGEIRHTEIRSDFVITNENDSEGEHED
jgi:uncharacterized membrane protein